MRVILRFLVTGKTDQELRNKIRKNVAGYLKLGDPTGDLALSEEIDQKTDMEMTIVIGEEAEGDYTYTADVTVRIK